MISFESKAESGTHDKMLLCVYLGVEVPQELKYVKVVSLNCHPQRESVITFIMRIKHDDTRIDVPGLSRVTEYLMLQHYVFNQIVVATQYC